MARRKKDEPISPEELADNLVDEMLKLADEASNASKARLQIDVRKWLAAKLAPEKYGGLKHGSETSKEPNASTLESLGHIPTVLLENIAGTNTDPNEKKEI